MISVSVMVGFAWYNLGTLDSSTSIAVSSVGTSRVRAACKQRRSASSVPLHGEHTRPDGDVERPQRQFKESLHAKVRDGSPTSFDRRVV